MRFQRLTVGAVAAAFAFSLVPASAWAQAGSRPNNTGSSSGSAVPRGGGGGGSSSSGGSSSGSSGSSASAPSGGGSSVRSGGAREREPQRPQAVRRGDGSGAAPAGRRDGSSASTSGDEGRRRAVPEYSRPRDGRNVTGDVAERRGGIPGGGGGGSVIYYPYDPYYWYYGGFGSRYGFYSRYGYYSPYWSPGYGFGLGYFGYDPFFGGGGGYDYGYPSYAGGYSSQYRETGNLRLKVKPANAQVFVDGLFVGVVDSFDGVFQKLGIESGAHKIELRADGYETIAFDVLVTPGETVTYKGEMKPLGRQ